MAQQETHYLTQTEQLLPLCQKWQSKPLLAVDTEFLRTNTFFPKPALIQLNDGEANYLIDPLQIEDLDCLKAVLVNPDVRKVLHACSEDLEVFHRLFGVLPENVFDTQIAAAFTGRGFSLGYSNLVEQVLGVQLPKDETRSDWLQRPLSDSQKLYAALDVEYLFVVSEQLLSELTQLQRLNWVENECEALVSAFYDAQDPANAAQRLRGAWRLQERQLALLRTLASWRDSTARARNVPRNYVMKDKSLYRIAESFPSHLGALRKVAELPDKTIRRYGDEVMEIVEQVNGLSDGELPERMPRGPSSSQQATIKILREKLAEIAVQARLAPEVIAKKKDYEFIVRAAASGENPSQSVLPPGIASWRAELIKPVVDKYLWNT